MKRMMCIWLALFGACSLSIAQLPENLSRNVLKKILVYEEVEYGNFQVDLSKAVNYSEQVGEMWFPYIFVTKNKYSEKGNLYVDGGSLLSNRNFQVRTYRIGPTSNKSIFVMKSLDDTNDDIGMGMELVRAYGFFYPVCDSIIDLSDDGYVYQQKGTYYYSPYRTIYDNKPMSFPITWAERKVFETKDKLRFTKDAYSRLSKGSVYHESADGHYYYLYRDQYMPNTVLVVDDVYVELFDKYDDADFKLKFSFNGKHWMAVGNDCFWVDGQLKSVEGYSITDFVITNDGHYGYKAIRKGAENEGEAVVVDGQLIRRNAKVSYFALDAKGHLKFRFLSGDRLLQYENEKVTDVTGQFESVYFPEDQQVGQVVTVQSNDGLHKLTYQKDKPGVNIDGVQLTESVPCFAVMDEKNNCFVWNAIEKKGEETELVIYKYTIVNNFFRNMFK